MWVTDYDVLPVDHVVERRDGYLVVRSPGNPAHYWGNLLLFDDAPEHRDGERWERLFELEFGESPLVEHVTLACGHIPQVESPEALHRAITRFLDAKR